MLPGAPRSYQIWEDVKVRELSWHVKVEVVVSKMAYNYAIKVQS